jgi:hypothetical protein
MRFRDLIALACAVLLLAAATACSSPGDDTMPVAEVGETSADPAAGPSAEGPAEPEPLGISEEEAYALAAADGAAYDPPFSVYRPLWLPEGFAFESAHHVPADATDGSGGLLITYAAGDAIITVGVGIGDIGDVAPVTRTAWGTYGECSVYDDAWDDSYIALAPTSGAYTPNVRTVGVSLEDLERVLGNLELVEP